MSLYESVGGAAACRKLSTEFYALVERDPVLRPLFPGKTLHCAIEELAAFLAQFLGGPSEDSQRRWWISLRESHQRFKIGPKEREAWMRNMANALDAANMEAGMRGALKSFFEHASTYVVNQGTEPAAATEEMHPEFACRWEAQRTLDETVAAIRSLDRDRAVELEQRHPIPASVRAALLAEMIVSRDSGFLEHVHACLRSNPALVHERYNGRTLLHTASGAGALETVNLLLQLGADVYLADSGGHTPLYYVGNQCKWEGGAAVVRALIQAGARVDANDGVKHCTALHMAARRGHVRVAETLLDCGAGIEARDSVGDTPLRRAVNCGKLDVASLLLDRGADKHSQGSKALTPFSAARTPAMKQLLSAPLKKPLH